MKLNSLQKTLRSALLLTAISISFSALAQNIAIVNGKAVPKSRAEALKEQLIRSGRPVTPEDEEQIKENVIAREIFMQEAQKLGLDATNDFKDQMELARQTIMIRELFTDFQKKNPVTDAEIKAEYDKFAAANGGKEYRARHILVAKEDQAKAIIAQLKQKSAKFEDIAKKQSIDTGSGAKGGDLDWAAPSNFVKEFGDAMSLVCSQTLNGCDARGCLIKPAPTNTRLSAELFW